MCKFVSFDWEKHSPGASEQSKAVGMNNTNRVENEVAAMHLARTAIAQKLPKYAELVPNVYTWKATVPNPIDEEDFGWIAMQYVEGSSLHAAFKTFTRDEKISTVKEIAAIFSVM